MGELCYMNYISVKLLKSIAQKYTVDFPVVHPMVHSLPYNDSDKESTCQCRRLKFKPQFREIPWSRKWQPTTVFWPGKAPGQRSLVGYSPWGCKRVEDNSATEQQMYNTYFLSLPNLTPPFRRDTRPRVSALDTRYEIRDILHRRHAGYVPNAL